MEFATGAQSTFLFLLDFVKLTRTLGCAAISISSQSWNEIDIQYTIYIFHSVRHCNAIAAPNSNIQMENEKNRRARKTELVTILTTTPSSVKEPFNHVRRKRQHIFFDSSYVFSSQSKYIYTIHIHRSRI